MMTLIGILVSAAFTSLVWMAAVVALLPVVVTAAWVGHRVDVRHRGTAELAPVVALPADGLQLAA